MGGNGEFISNSLEIYMMSNLKKLMAEANPVIDTVSVHEVIDKWANQDTIFVDVREIVEREKVGMIPGSTHAREGL